MLPIGGFPGTLQRRASADSSRWQRSALVDAWRRDALERASQKIHKHTRLRNKKIYSGKETNNEHRSRRGFPTSHSRHQKRQFEPHQSPPDPHRNPVRRRCNPVNPDTIGRRKREKELETRADAIVNDHPLDGGGGMAFRSIIVGGR